MNKDIYTHVSPWHRNEDNYNLLEEFGGEGNGTPLQYSRLENPMDREAW